jgi:endogenous inhibitor of DNA gyrase (YacG/DUF329 family)
MTALCPTCKKPVELSARDPWRPFCSERCRLVDLGGWLGEKRSLPVEAALATKHQGGEPITFCQADHDSL